MISRFRRWAFEPVDTAPMAALRIACGLLVLGWATSLLPDLETFLGDDGLQIPDYAGRQNGWSWWVLPVFDARWSLVALVVAAVALVVGWRTRIASVVVALLLVDLQRRNVYVLNSGDLLLRELAILVALMPAGEVWSLDARRRGSSQKRAPWGLRLLQLQVSAVYFFSVVAKLRGGSWQDGTAVGKAVQLEDLQRFVVPEWAATSVTLSALLTYGTLLAEGFLVFGLWLPKTRWYAMAAGVAIHLGIEATLLIGWFSLTIISTYLAFVPAATYRRWFPAPTPPEPEPGPDEPAPEEALRH